MAIAEEFMLGNTHVIIMDDYCKDKTKAEVDAILDRCAQIAMNAWAGESAKKARAEAAETATAET